MARSYNRIEFTNSGWNSLSALDATDMEKFHDLFTKIDISNNINIPGRTFSVKEGPHAGSYVIRSGHYRALIEKIAENGSSQYIVKYIINKRTATYYA